MVLTFDAETHTYTLDGIVVPSVTEITRFLHYQAEYADKESRDRAARRGTAIHEATALLDYGEEIEIENELSGYLIAWKQFKRDFHFDVYEIERVVGGKLWLDEYDTMGALCGTIDRVGFIEQTPVIVDIKTGSKINKLALQAQLSAYAILRATETDIDPIRNLLGVQLKKDGTYTTYQAPYNVVLVRNLYQIHIMEQEAKKKWKLTV